jgi:hypothetical protein
MRLCKCGGEVREHDLIGDRVAWTCNSCKRYEIIELKPLEELRDSINTVDKTEFTPP